MIIFLNFFFVGYRYRTSPASSTPKFTVLSAILGHEHSQQIALPWSGSSVFVRRAILRARSWWVLLLFYGYDSLGLSTNGFFGLTVTLLTSAVLFKTLFPDISLARNREVSQQLALFVWSLDALEQWLLIPSCKWVSGWLHVLDRKKTISGVFFIDLKAEWGSSLGNGRCMSLSLLQFSPVSQTTSKAGECFYSRDFAWRTGAMRSDQCREQSGSLHPSASVCPCAPHSLRLSALYDGVYLPSPSGTGLNS